MYKYTINPEILKHYRKHNEGYSNERYNWYRYLRSKNLIKIKADTQKEHRDAMYIEGMIGWFLPQNMVYYSKVKRSHINVQGYLVEVHPLFKVEKVD